jgi:hypothetical protein
MSSEKRERRNEMETNEIISQTAGVIPAIWERISNLRIAFINRNGFLYACNFETRLNLDIIASINIEELKTIKIVDPAFVELVTNFETSVTLDLLAGDDRRHYRRLVKLLKKHWNNPEKLLEAEEEGTEIETIESVLDNLSFVVQKIEALKRIVHIAEKDASFFKELKLDIRIKNINTALCAIRKCLKAIILGTT